MCTIPCISRCTIRGTRQRTIQATIRSPAQELAIKALPAPRTIAEDKAVLRRRIRAARRHRATQDLHHEGESLARVVLDIPEVQRARVASLYANMPGEPETGPLRRLLREAGVRVMLPIVLAERRLQWAWDDDDLVAPAGFGGPEPRGPHLGELAPGGADVLLIPALAVDTLGHRLGQGRGYYDTMLAQLSRSIHVIALVHDHEILDAAVEPVPIEAHDRPVDAVASSLRCLRLR